MAGISSSHGLPLPAVGLYNARTALRRAGPTLSTIPNDEDHYVLNGPGVDSRGAPPLASPWGLNFAIPITKAPWSIGSTSGHAKPPVGSSSIRPVTHRQRSPGHPGGPNSGRRGAHRQYRCARNFPAPPLYVVGGSRADLRLWGGRLRFGNHRASHHGRRRGKQLSRPCGGWTSGSGRDFGPKQPRDPQIGLLRLRLALCACSRDHRCRKQDWRLNPR
jgi:hypothetical protein